MRVLLITDNHSPTGGAEKYFFELKKNLQERPDLEVFSLGFGKYAETGNDFQILRATRNKMSKLFWQIFRHPRTYRQLRHAITQINPDVIHLHNIKQHSAALLKAISGYRVVQTIHDYSIVCPSAMNLHQDLLPCASGFRLSCFWQHHHKFNKLIYLGLVSSFMMMQKRLKKSVNQFMTVSPLLAEYMQKNGLHPVTYVPPFKNKVASTSQTPKAGHFLYAGNFGAHKGTNLLIEEFALACQQNPDLHLTLAGSGENETQLHHLVKQNKLENNVTFIPWMNDISELYLSHFAVIAPSIVMEAFGLLISEAMSHQRPVIGSNRGSIPWLIEDNHTGLIFDPVKKGDLADKMLQLANDTEHAKQLGKNGYEKISRLMDTDHALQKIIGVYESASSQTTF
ncbi:MAG TPA: glycosyltransferase family 4 protein [Gammaproteobacteria bacterium]|jgi:glycosyltransferase involved in cell wall biosynthesis|nr:glycosyltransferase family 4 protein [Gammaproteobacteria bacterium]